MSFKKLHDKLFKTLIFLHIKNKFKKKDKII